MYLPGVLVLVACAVSSAMPPAAAQPAPIAVDYPAAGSIFPSDFAAPTFLWRDSVREATLWKIDIKFDGGAAGTHTTSSGERLRTGEIDPRAVAQTNKPPALTPAQAEAHTWKPDGETWTAIKKNSAGKSAIVTISGYSKADPKRLLSQGRVAIQTSTDPVGAPIFYRDVPLMPSETEKGVIKPLAASAVPLIAWRLRNVGEDRSRLLMDGIHSCANCHSVSRDGKTMGMDVDGPANDKGLYAIFPIRPESAIRQENVVAWSTFRGKLGGRLRVGFMSQVSPDGQYVVTMINDPGEEQSEYQRRKQAKEVGLNYYVANFKDYRFLQVFYPTRGILAWYSRETGKLQQLPGADDPRYVHTNAVWSPDGKYLVFARAEAKDPYAPGSEQAQFANDPKEMQIRYDLYRIPFNGGKGGTPEPVRGASANGMSNSFPRISPDGRWIVYVQARNGLLMRPDSRLYIVPSAGGEARRMRCNTPLMNSWHSFSPNGRWLVFSSKSRSPYTQMYLTHIDEAGNDSPAILIENATAANRAVNIPEFVNIPPDGLRKIDAPVTEYYRVADAAEELFQKREYQEAISEWKKALELSPDEALAHNNLGIALAAAGRTAEAIPEYEKALQLSPEYPEAYNNLGNALARIGRADEAITQYEKALELNPKYASAHTNLGTALARQGRIPEALPHLEKSVEFRPDNAEARGNLGLALAQTGKVAEAVPHFAEAVRLSGGKDPVALTMLSAAYGELGRFQEALDAARKALQAATGQRNVQLIEALKTRISAYEARTGGAR